MLFPKKTTDNRKKNTKRKITEKVFQECFSRDKGCVICWTQFNLDRPHHVLYGNEQNLWEDRNNADQLVTICKSCHHKLHFEWGNNYRELTKKYLWLL